MHSFYLPIIKISIQVDSINIRIEKLIDGGPLLYD